MGDFGRLRPSWEEETAALRVFPMTKQSNKSLCYAYSAQAKSGADQPTSNALTAFGNPLLAFFYYFEFLFFDTFFYTIERLSISHASTRCAL